MQKIESNRDYNRRFEKGVAAMSIAEFQKWNPGFTEKAAEARINEAKAFVAKLPENLLQEEVDARYDEGVWTEMSMRELTERLKTLGYKLDRRMDCRSVSHWMTGSRAGKSYPCLSMKPVQIDNRMSFSHFQARRDDNFKALQKMRGHVFVVSKTAICEL